MCCFTLVEIILKRMLFCDLHCKSLRNSERHLLQPRPPTLPCALSAWFQLVVERLHLARFLHPACVRLSSQPLTLCFTSLSVAYVCMRWESGRVRRRRSVGRSRCVITGVTLAGIPSQVLPWNTFWPKEIEHMAKFRIHRICLFVFLFVCFVCIGSNWEK